MKLISVYTSPSCGACKNVIEFLSATSAGFEVKDITEKEEWFEEAIKIGRKCPMVKWNDKVSFGYKPEELVAICEEWEYGSV